MIDEHFFITLTGIVHKSQNLLILILPVLSHVRRSSAAFIYLVEKRVENARVFVQKTLFVR